MYMLSRGEIESEKHFIFDCKNYKAERDNMFDGIFGGNKTKEHMGGLKTIFNENDPVGLNELGKFIKICTEKRGITLLLQELIKKVERNLQETNPCRLHDPVVGEDADIGVNSVIIL